MGPPPPAPMPSLSDPTLEPMIQSLIPPPNHAAAPPPDLAVPAPVIEKVITVPISGSDLAGGSRRIRLILDLTLDSEG